MKNVVVCLTRPQYEVH